jgi:transcriptional regulator GlxA family with amidase domain
VSIISYFPAQRMDEDLTPGVEAIAQGIGFGAAESFRARFRRIVRIAPRDYRRASASA